MAEIPESARPSATALAARAVQVGRLATVALLTGIPAVCRASVHARTFRAAEDVAGVRLAAFLWSAGPTFVKLGQLAATRRDVLPGSWCDAMEDALARGRAHPRTTPDAEHGSVATVRREAGSSGDLAVKRIRPRAAARLRTDVEIVRLVARVVRRSAPWLRAPVPDLLEDLCDIVVAQLDLEREALMLGALHHDLDGRLPVSVPRPVVDRSDTDQLVMPWLAGQDDVRDESFGERRRRAETLILAVFHMVFRSGHVHCDLHPGNWWVQPDGRIALVDAGFGFTMDTEVRERFADFFYGVVSNDPDLCSAQVLASLRRPVDAAAADRLRREMRPLIAEVSGRRAADFSLVGFSRSLFELQRRCGAYTGPGFVLPILALLAIEGQVKELDPRLDSQALAGPIILEVRALRRRRERSGLLRVGDAS